MDKIGWAIVGTSGFANSEAARAIKESGAARLIGAVGSTPDKSRQFQARHGASRSYSSLDELARDPEVSVVWVAGPNNLHSSTSIELARAGKHILVEKPMAIAVEDAKAMVAAASRHNVALRIGYHHRFRSAHARLREIVASGQLGKIGFFRIHMFARYPGPPAAWRQAANTSGGWAINDVGTHLIDLMLWITGLPAEVAGAKLATQRFDVETDDCVALLFSLGKQGIGLVETSTALASPSSRIEIHGDAGWARAEGTLGGSGNLETSAKGKIALPEHDPFAAEVRAMNEAIENKKTISAEGPIGVENVRLIQRAREMSPL